MIHKNILRCAVPSAEKPIEKVEEDQKPRLSSSPTAQLTNRQTRVSLSIDEPGPRWVTETGKESIVNFCSSRQDHTEWVGVSDWISENDEESVMAALLQQSAQEFYSSKKE